MLSRRTFHKSLAAIALVSLAGGRAAAQGSPDDIALGRLTFGATPQDRITLAKLGLKGWVKAQLDMPLEITDITARLHATTLWIEYEAGRTEDDKPWEALEEYRALGLMDKDPADLLYLLDFDLALDFAERERPASEVIAASIVRAVHTPAQLREVMTQFWHEHFSVNALKSEETAVFFPEYDRIMRKHAFGNFRELLGAVAHAPAMSFYLNNDTSRASPANENYARELLELHTLGQENYFNDLYDDWKVVPRKDGLATGYIDQDVYEVARAFSGWSVGDGREVDNGVFTPKDGRSAYIEAWHDPYQKRILAQEYAANSAPLEDGERVLDMLAAHPGTASFVSRKMLRRLGIEAPSEAYHTHVAGVFHAARTAPDQIAQTLRAIIFHDEFSNTPAQKLRTPFEFTAAMFRAAGTDVSPRSDGIFDLMGRAGWQQHRVNPPTGHSDDSAHWANTASINGMINIALEGHSEWLETNNAALRVIPDGVKTFGQLGAYWEGRFNAPKGSLDDVLKAFDIQPDNGLWDDIDGIEWVNGNMVAALTIRPDFMFR